jgi:hypothetical protein
MTEERWRPVAIPPHDKHYEVSNLGRVRRSTPTSAGPAGRLKKLQWWDRPPKSLHVLLSSDGTRGFYKVAKVVALTWLGPQPSPEHEVNHKSGDHADNSVDNLEWLTGIENNAHATRMGLRAPWTRDRLPKLKADVIPAIRAATGTFASIGAQFGVSERSVRNVKSRKTWRHIP